MNAIVILISALITFFNIGIYAGSKGNEDKMDFHSIEQRVVLKSYIAGEGGQDYFGTSIATEGDFNGDGKRDLIIGATGAGDKKEGRVYIFYGKKMPEKMSASEADVIITGENGGDSFGWYVCSESDINGDGRDDLLVGAISTNGKYIREGSVYLFYGKNLKGRYSASDADKKITGSRKEQFFGWSISAEGDLNNDGRKDVVIGSPGHQEGKGGIMAGEVDVFFGGELDDVTVSDDAGVIIPGEAFNSHTGNSISCGGDINGDGIDDLAVGAFFSEIDQFRGGRVYLFFGGRKFRGRKNAATADVIIRADAEDTWIGDNVLIIPDINGDGAADLVVSASGEDTKVKDSGIVYIFYGNKLRGRIFISSADLRLEGKPVGRKFGSSVTMLGDVDGDGMTDIAVSEPGGKSDSLNMGSVYFFLSSLLDKGKKTIPGYVFKSRRADTKFGNVIGFSDINGDRIKELVVGANYDNIGGEASGIVMIYQWMFRKKE